MFVIIAHWNEVIRYITEDMVNYVSKMAKNGPEKYGPDEFEHLLELRWKCAAYTYYRDGLTKSSRYGRSFRHAGYRPDADGSDAGRVERNQQTRACTWATRKLWCRSFVIWKAHTFCGRRS